MTILPQYDGKKLTPREIAKINKIRTNNTPLFKAAKQLKPKPAKPIRKERSDLGKKRNKYDSSLPAKYKSYLMRANRRGLTFEFTPEEFQALTAKTCTYCGGYNKIGVDRLDSSIGYTKDNSVPCCTMCNMMKYTYSNHAFLKHVVTIYHHNNSVGSTKLFL